MKALSISDGINSFDFADGTATLNIRNAEGFEYPEIIDVAELLPQRSGGIFIDSDFGMRYLSWEGVYIGENRHAKRQQMTNVLKSGQLLTLSLTTFANVLLEIPCYIKSLSMPIDLMKTAYRISLVCPDHRFLSQESQVASTGVTELVGGVTLPTELPASFAITSGSPYLSLSNNGNENALPEFVISGPGTNFVVQNQTTGESFNVNVTLTAGETITIDTLNRTVIQSNNQNQYGSFSGTFWELEPSTNQVYFNASSGSDSNTSLTINYQHSYRGI